jgi:hypothetical protein
MGTKEVQFVAVEGIDGVAPRIAELKCGEKV